MKNDKIKEIVIVGFIAIVLIIVFMLWSSNKEKLATITNSELKVVETPISQPIVTEKTIETEVTTVDVTIGEQQFSAKLNDTVTARQLIEILPITMKMEDINFNEKYFYLPKRLETNAQKISLIKKGDIMLYGDNCLVIFYKEFSSSYSYTRLGQFDDIEGLESALGSGNVEINWSISTKTKQ